jgi:hypothetical protein
MVSWERLWAFSGGRFRLEGWPSKNIHTDLDFAKECGMSTVAASATQSMGHVAELLIDLFGEEWLSHGTMDCKFLRPIEAGDVLVSSAVISSKESVNGATKFTLEVSNENQKGDKVLAGKAAGFIGNVPPALLDDAYNKRLAELQAEVKMPDRSKIDSLEYVVGESRLNLTPLEYVPTPELNQQFLYAEEDFQPRYIEKSELGPPLVHPGLLLNWSNGSRSPSFKVFSGEFGLHARDEAFFYNPPIVGKKLIVTWPGMIGVYERRGRPWSAYQGMVKDEDGRLILRRITYNTVASQKYTKEYK